MIRCSDCLELVAEDLGADTTTRVAVFTAKIESPPRVAASGVEECSGHVLAMVSERQSRREICPLRRRMSRASAKHAIGAEQNCTIWALLVSINVHTNCSGEVSQRLAGSRLGV